MNIRFTAVLVALMGAALLAGGCVSQGQYDDVYASNQRAQDQLKKLQEILQTERNQNAKLLVEINRLEMLLAAERNKNQGLQGDLANLQATLDELRARYNALVNKQDSPMDLPVSVALPDALDKQLQQLVAKYGDLFDYDASKGVLRFKSDMTFARGSDDVAPRAKEALAQFAKIMADPVAAPYHVYIAGHTDDMRIVTQATKDRHPTNWYLSVHRAVAVQEELVRHGVADRRIGAMGFGEWHPIVPNAAGKRGHEKNRRVELWIVPPSRFLTTGDAIAAPAELPYDED
jgi:chemotaxis protein MotB